MKIINGIPWIQGYFFAPRVVFREKFTGDGVDTTFQLTGEANAAFNASFLLGDWNVSNLLIASASHVTGTDSKPTYDSIIPLSRNRVGVTSINSSGLVTLDYAPRNGVEFYVWYWYQLTVLDTLDDYEREDFVASMESETGTMSTLQLFDTNSSNTLSLNWDENDTTDRVLNIKVVGGDRTLTLDQNFTASTGGGSGGDTQEDLTISTGVAEVTAGAGMKTLTSESGVSDTLTQITGLAEGLSITLYAASGHTITVAKSDYLKLPVNFTLSGYKTITLLSIGSDTCVERARSANT